MKNLALLLLLMMFFQCKKAENYNTTHKSASKPRTEKNGFATKAENSEEINFYVAKSFKTDAEGNLFIANDFKLILNAESNVFELYKGGKLLDEVNLNFSNYQGPGYAVYLYESTANEDFKIILIEAGADPGVAFYNVVVLEKDKVLGNFYIGSPTTQSEETATKDFINFRIKNNEINVSFNKAEAFFKEGSKNQLKSDDKYYYLIRELK